MLLESPSAAAMIHDRPSLIETLRSTANGQIPLLAQHLRRLQQSAHSLHYPCPLARIEQALLTMAQQYQGQSQRLRLLLHANGQFELRCQPLIAPSTPGSTPGVILAAERLCIPDLWLHHKTTRRPLYEQAGLWLQSHPVYFDCLFFNQHDQLCEGSRSNVYLQLGDHWYTPALACGALPGVLRATLLESGQVRERILHLDDLMDAQGVRVSNAVHGWLDVHFDHKTSSGVKVSSGISGQSSSNGFQLSNKASSPLG